MSENEKPYLLYGEVMDWLETEHGLPRSTSRMLIENKSIQPVIFPGRQRAFYARAQIQRDVLDKLNPPPVVPAAAGPTQEKTA